MEFALSIEEEVSVEEAKELLDHLAKTLEREGYTVIYQEMTELKNANFPMGDLSLEEETFFQTKIRRMSKKK